MEMIQKIRDRAKKTNAKVVLPEGEEPRIIKGAAFISKEAIAKVILLGNKARIESALKRENADMRFIEIIDIEKSPDLEKYINLFYELRRHKGITPDQAKDEILKNTLYYGALMVKEGLAGGFVAGAANTTRDVARAVLWCIGIDRSIKTMSSSFIMILPNKNFGAEGLLVYADCGIVPSPTSKQLANIAVASSDLIKDLFDIEPKVAMLSFSTKGSGDIPEIEKIHEAIEIVRKTNPGLLIDGELQADAALVPEVAEIKAPQSPIKGRANVLIFPNLEAGNISYKLTQRLADARALGPLLQGLQAPCSDLSRGCSWEDVVDIVAVTALRRSHIEKCKV
ncbi:MAG: phosphate acetyltransferase [Candidatus Omnitrophota bacterium]